LNDNGVIYLNNSSINIKGVNFWGSPVQPKFFNMAFNKDRGEEIKKYWDLIPEDADVLITHTPPYGILDLTRKGVNVGCEELAKKIQELKIKLSLFGHVHEAQGEIVKDKTLFINTACIVSSTIIEA
jgi:Icc-related predicted phosphoesterase